MFAFWRDGLPTLRDGLPALFTLEFQLVNELVLLLRWLALLSLAVKEPLLVVAYDPMERFFILPGVLVQGLSLAR